MSHPRFSYQIVDVKSGFWGLKSERISEELNRLGAQGWELVSTLPPNGFAAIRLVLKRPQ